MLDQASYPVLWQISDQTGIRPEFLLPALFLESGLDPSVQNRSGAAFYGINQINADFLVNIGVDPQTYLTWPASAQLLRVVLPYMQNVVNRYGPLRSATRVEQANFLPATLPTATSLTSILASRGSDVYSANAGLDLSRSGTITVADLAAQMTKQVPHVQNEIARAYALRPGETPQDPVYGQDFTNSRKLVLAASIALLGGAVAWGIHEGAFDTVLRDIDGMLHGASRDLKYWLT